jgi:hypothetical protein
MANDIPQHDDAKGNTENPGNQITHGSRSCPERQQQSCPRGRRPAILLPALRSFGLALSLLTAWTSTDPLLAQSRLPADPEAPGPSLLTEPPAITRGIELYERLMDRADKPDGFYPEFGGLITGSGWLSVGPGYRHRIANGRGQVSVSGALSLRLYNMARARVDFPDAAGGRIAFGLHALYRDSLRVNYFGPGAASDESDRSGYRLRTTEVAGDAATTSGPVQITGRVGWIPQVRITRMGGRIPDYPDTQALFTESEAPGLDHPTSFLFAEIAAGADTRRDPGYPTRGGLYEVRWAGYSDRDADRYGFQRFDVGASQYVAIGSPGWVLALDGWIVGTRTGEGQTVPFYLLPSLGGKNTLRGYADFRFHDRNLELFSIESRWSLYPHVALAVFADAGKVASRFGALGVTGLERSVGAGIRVHNAHSMLGRLDIAHGPEGWHAIATMSAPFKRSTPDAGKRALVPFVP